MVISLWRDNNTDIRMCVHRAENGVVMEWSPDGALLLVATTAPRMRVDNGLLIMGLHGEHLHRQDMQVRFPD